jgi:predicted nucleic acid-binding protein
MSAVVSDTTSLIALAGQGRLDLLGACFEQVLLPDAVYAEWLAGDPTLAQRVPDLPFLRVESVTDTALLAELELLLDRGEAEALTLAKTRHLPLLVDEKKGRAVARMMGVPVLGLVGLLVLAVERKRVPASEAEQILNGARERGFRVGDRLVESFRSRLRGMPHATLLRRHEDK